MFKMWGGIHHTLDFLRRSREHLAKIGGGISPPQSTRGDSAKVTCTASDR